MTRTTAPPQSEPALQASMCSIAFQLNDKWKPNPRIEMPLPQAIAIVAEHGFAGIEIWQPHWESASVAEQARSLTLLSRHGLTVPMLSGYYNFTKSQALAAESLAKGHRILKQAAQLGARNIRIFTGNHRSADANGEQWYRTTHCLRELCQHGAELGIGLCLETHDWNLMDTVDGTLRLLESVDHPQLGLIFQASTFGKSTWFWALQRLSPWVRHVHAPPEKVGLMADPYAYREQLNYLLKQGFTGFVSLEYMGTDPIQRARSDGRALINLCRQLNSRTATA